MMFENYFLNSHRPQVWAFMIVSTVNTHDRGDVKWPSHGWFKGSFICGFMYHIIALLHEVPPPVMLVGS